MYDPPRIVGEPTLYLIGPATWSREYVFTAQGCILSGKSYSWKIVVKVVPVWSSGTWISALIVTIYSPISDKSVFKGTLKSERSSLCKAKAGRFVTVIV